MELINPRSCIWCWDMERVTTPSKWRVIASYDGAIPIIEHLCDDCLESHNKQLVECTEAEKDTNGFWVRGIAVGLIDEPILVFQRGDRINIRMPFRPVRTATVVHCYLARKTLQPMVVVIADGKKWPGTYHSSFCEKRVMTEKGRPQ